MVAEARHITDSSQNEHMLQMSEATKTIERLANANAKRDADTSAMTTQLAAIQQALTALSTKVKSSSSISNNDGGNTGKHQEKGRGGDKNKRKYGTTFDPKKCMLQPARKLSGEKKRKYWDDKHKWARANAADFRKQKTAKMKQDLVDYGQKKE